MTDFGYHVYAIDNQSSDATYNERAEFPLFEGMEMIAPERKNNYEVTVNAGEQRLILMRQDCNGFNLSKSFFHKLILGEQQLIQKCLNEGSV